MKLRLAMTWSKAIIKNESNKRMERENAVWDDKGNSPI
jgi:hypothetical protein